MSLKRRLRDWWRGYSDDDLISVRYKLVIARRPGEVVPLSAREMKALIWALNGAGVGLRVESEQP